MLGTAVAVAAAAIIALVVNANEGESHRVIPSATSTQVTAPSTSVVSTGTVVFSIKNLGRLRHRFEVCAVPGPVGPNSCAGKETGWLAPGAAAFLEVRFRKPGRYEYLCAVRGHAAAGMKGLLTVR